MRSADAAIDLFPELKTPKSTLRGWLNGECAAPSAALATRVFRRRMIEEFARGKT